MSSSFLQSKIGLLETKKKTQFKRPYSFVSTIHYHIFFERVSEENSSTRISLGKYFFSKEQHYILDKGDKHLCTELRQTFVKLLILIWCQYRCALTTARQPQQKLTSRRIQIHDLYQLSLRLSVQNVVKESCRREHCLKTATSYAKCG